VYWEFASLAGSAFSAALGKNARVSIAFNGDAVPFAVVAILFGAWLLVVFRRCAWVGLQKRRWDDPRRGMSAKFRERYTVCLATLCFALAAFALFYDFH
jgi:hypothetical protein